MDPYPPATVLIHILQDVDAAGGGGSATLDRARLQAEVQSLVAFIRDDTDGLAWVFQLIRTRQVR